MLQFHYAQKQKRPGHFFASQGGSVGRGSQHGRPHSRFGRSGERKDARFGKPLRLPCPRLGNLPQKHFVRNLHQPRRRRNENARPFRTGRHGLGLHLHLPRLLHAAPSRRHKQNKFPKRLCDFGQGRLALDIAARFCRHGLDLKGSDDPAKNRRSVGG